MRPWLFCVPFGITAGVSPKHAPSMFYARSSVASVSGQVGRPGCILLGRLYSGQVPMAAVWVAGTRLGSTCLGRGVLLGLHPTLRGDGGASAVVVSQRSLGFAVVLRTMWIRISYANRIVYVIRRWIHSVAKPRTLHTNRPSVDPQLKSPSQGESKANILTNRSKV